jgi:hypothetical protein
MAARTPALPRVSADGCLAGRPADSSCSVHKRKAGKSGKRNIDEFMEELKRKQEEDDRRKRAAPTLLNPASLVGLPSGATSALAALAMKIGGNSTAKGAPASAASAPAAAAASTAAAPAPAAEPKAAEVRLGARSRRALRTHAQWLPAQGSGSDVIDPQSTNLYVGNLHPYVRARARAVTVARRLDNRRSRPLR